MAPKRPLARYRAFEWVRNAIVAGEIGGGEYIEESTVCEAVGVSRTPVREAFNQLAAEKYITLTPRHGAQVRTVSAQELQEVYEVRRLIEGRCVEILCRSRVPVTETARIALEERLRAAAAAAESPADPELRVEASRADWTFHYSIVSAAGNSVLTETYEFLRSRQQRVSIATGVKFPELVKLFDEHHVAMLEAWRACDEDEFKRILGEHLRPADRILASLEAG
ncbi:MULTISPECIES: GntR family transcriptional regulator [Brevibacterium]|uniref:GntR family transcriptional regulator n=1 Tax=Brevibacterium TaxID=1696 RepID=UPI0025C3420B|nr:GntR family transcriptional regulator [Brevibacterium sp.]